jgi:hypothetical protein
MGSNLKKSLSSLAQPRRRVEISWDQLHFEPYPLYFFECIKNLPMTYYIFTALIFVWGIFISHE